MSAPVATPLPPTPLIGREGERATLAAWLGGEARLATLVGPPGVGKTLLALHLARDLAGHFDDGAAFVPLDAIREAALVPGAVARALGLREAAGRSVADGVREHLAGRAMLLVLDNFEQVIEAAPFVGDLLAGCPALVVLVTSRTPLRLRAERQFPLEPLATGGDGGRGRRNRDEGDGSAAASGLAAGEIPPAVTLFVERARAVRPTFTLTAENAADVAAICARLDGLPLALELAAARISMLSAREIAQRLDRRLAFLTRGHRDQPSRHQTLRAAIDWSYDLLADGERRLLRLLGAFTGGATFDALEAVAAPHTADLTHPPVAAAARVDLIDALADHSLLRRTEDGDGSSRFRMLETIREYAVEQSEAVGEAEDDRRRLAAWCLSLATLAYERFGGGEQATWEARLEAELDNVRATLRWTLTANQVTLGLELAGALTPFWERRGYYREGRGWFDELLTRGSRSPPAVRARALAGAGELTILQGDYADARPLVERALALYREAGDEGGMSDALHSLGEIATERSEFDAATGHYTEELALSRALGDERRIARGLIALGTVASYQVRLDEAEANYDEALAMYRRLGDPTNLALGLNNLAQIARNRAQPGRARPLFEEAIAIARAHGNRRQMAIFLTSLADVVRQLRDPATAYDQLREALALAQETGDRPAIAYAYMYLSPVSRALGDEAAARRYTVAYLELVRTMREGRRSGPALWNAAATAVAADLPIAAARLFAQVAAMEARNGDYYASIAESKRYAEALREQLGDDAFAAAWREGAEMEVPDAVEYAIAQVGNAAPPPPTGVDVVEPVGESPAGADAAVLSGITARELEVLRLIAAGRSNSDIAARLVISRRTVEHHLANIYTKIGASGRVEAAAYALRQGLVSEE